MSKKPSAPTKEVKKNGLPATTPAGDDLPGHLSGADAVAAVERAAIAGYDESRRCATGVFGVDFVKAHPMVVFRLHDVTPDAIDPTEFEGDARGLQRATEKRGAQLQAILDDVTLARELTEHYGRLAGVPQPTFENVFGVYDRVFGGDTATGDPADLEMAHRITTQVFGDAVSFEVLFEVYDREVGSPYATDDK